VITPSYNQAQYLERTIKSVLDQGYENLEYVIVDGGSTDGSVEIIRRYEDQLAWWVSEKDEGQTDAINKGIRGTTGEIVAYINSDDYYLPGAFERAIEVMDETAAKYIGGAVLDIDDFGITPIGAWRPEPPAYYEDWPRGRQWWVIVPFYLPQSSVFWRRELFERHGLFRRDMHYVFDGEFMCRLALAGEPLKLLPGEALSVRGVHEEQKSFDPVPFKNEIERYAQIFRRDLTRWERLKLDLVRALRRLGFYRARDWLRVKGGLRSAIFNAAVVPILGLGGDLLDRVPDRLRPPIRTRDRPPRSRRSGHPG
jgi:glycosyltransferase involved in cell wall biosynthesis